MIHKGSLEGEMDDYMENIWKDWKNNIFPSVNVKPVKK